MKLYYLLSLLMSLNWQSVKCILTKLRVQTDLIQIFFNPFWPVLGKDIFNACVCWLENKEFPASLNDTLITLIPKCETSVTMRELRPIALCNVLYKMIAKEL